MLSSVLWLRIQDCLNFLLHCVTNKCKLFVLRNSDDSKVIFNTSTSCSEIFLLQFALRRKP